MRLSNAGSCPIAAPTPLLRPADRARPDRIQDDVAAHFEQIAVFIDEDRSVPALKDVPHPVVSPIVGLRVDTI